MARSDIVDWLVDTQQTHDRFLKETMRALLLDKLLESLLSPTALSAKINKKKPDWGAYLKYILLGLAGTIYAICDGFDGLTSILFLLPGVPLWSIFVMGIAFSTLSVAVFFGFDLVDISTNLDVKLSHSRHLLDVLVEQTETITQIRKQIKHLYKMADQDELTELHDLVNMLMLRFGELDDARKIYTDELDKTYLKGLKLTVAAISGILYFSYGFFSGQSFLINLAVFFGLSAMTGFWPVLAAGMVVGLSALSIYWFLARPAIENLVGRWLGFDEDKIALLAGEDLVEKQRSKLEQLELDIAAAEEWAKGRADGNVPHHPLPSTLTASHSGPWRGNQTAAGYSGRIFPQQPTTANGYMPVSSLPATPTSFSPLFRK